MPGRRLLLYPSFLPKDEVPDFVLEDVAVQKEERERQFLRGRFPPIATSDLDLLAKERTSAGTRTVLPPTGKSWAQRGPERKEREREVRLPVLKGWKGTPQEKQHCTVPRMQQHFPQLRSKLQGTEKPQAGKVSCKKTNKEKITCLPPKAEKGRTLPPPLEIEEAFAPSIRARHVLAILDSYKVCRDGWRKKVEQNRLLRDRPKEYQSYVKKMKLQKDTGRRKAK